MNNFEKKAKQWLNSLSFIEILLWLAFPIYTPTRWYLSPSSLLIRAFQVNETAVSAVVLPYPDGFFISPITPEIERRITGLSYPSDCPVSLADLRYVTVLHMGFDGLTHQGELIVHQEIADIILFVFFRLYDMGYPIEKIQLIDEYGADDEASMADNNTSAFCWRNITGTDTVSLHGYGLAIDINPLYNPYVCWEIISPAASPYNRETETVSSPYFMTEEDPCVRLFKENGFDWGGDWNSPKDYQHFEYRKTAAR